MIYFERLHNEHVQVGVIRCYKLYECRAAAYHAAEKLWDLIRFHRQKTAFCIYYLCPCDIAT